VVPRGPNLYSAPPPACPPAPIRAHPLVAQAEIRPWRPARVRWIWWVLLGRRRRACPLPSLRPLCMRVPPVACTPHPHALARVIPRSAARSAYPGHRASPAPGSRCPPPPRPAPPPAPLLVRLCARPPTLSALTSPPPRPPAAAGPRLLPAPRPRLADERDRAGDAARAAAARGGAALCARARRRRRGEGVRQDLLRRAPASRRAQRPAQPRPDLRGAPAVRHQQGGGQGGPCAHPHTPRAPPPRPACVLARAARRLLPSAAPDRAPRARSWPRCCL